MSAAPLGACTFQRGEYHHARRLASRIVKASLKLRRRMLKDVFERLEPCAPKGACTVQGGWARATASGYPTPAALKMAF